MFNIHKILENIPITDKIAIFIRHADKHPERIEVEQFICNGLTRAGKIKSINFSKTLFERNIEYICTSPVLRCIETAECFKNSYYKSLNIKNSDILGSPGAFIKNSKLAGQIFIETKDIYLIIEEYYTKKDLPGFYHIDIGCNKIIQYLMSIVEEQGTTLFISHDFILGTLITNILSMDIFSGNKINYLEGFCLTKNDNTISLHIENNIIQLGSKNKYDR